MKHLRIEVAVWLVSGLLAGVYAAQPVPEPGASTARPEPSTSSTVSNRTMNFDVAGGVKLEMVWVPAGKFEMGSPSDEEGRDSDEKQRTVEITKRFWLGRYEVTQEQWVRAMGHNPSNFQEIGKRAPVETVRWEDCQDFRKLNSVAAGGGFRLPTEAEWEYACRAGTKTAFCYGNSLNSSMANFDGNHPYGGAAKLSYRQRTVVVGSFKPNAWGLYDMHGNVAEWCEDRYGEYPSGVVTDPPGPPTASFRVFRGGSWGGQAKTCRSATRARLVAGHRDFNLGFRLARDP
jgi:formylglycine-generating enzyme required for sulfatase activity